MKDDTWRRGSIRSRLLLWLLLPLIMIGFVALLDSYNEARSTSDEVSDRVLAGSVLAISERVFVNEEGNLEVDIPYVALQMLTSSENDRVFYRIEDTDGNFITGYRNLELPEIESRSQDIVFGYSSFRSADVRVAVLRSAASSNTKSLGFLVAVAETTNARQAVAQDLLIRSGIRLTLIIGAAALLVWFAVSRSLLPLKRLQEAVARRSPDDIRPIEHKVPYEVNGLVVTINALVLRFANSIEALRNFTSNASHQFRTPLAIIRTHLEVAVREQDPDIREKAIVDAQYAVDDAERMMAQMLTLARIDASSRKDLQNKRCDLAKITRKVCEDTVLQFSHKNKPDIDLGYSGAETLAIYGDEALIQEVARNVIDNAIQHGGADLLLDVEVSVSESHANLIVTDSGDPFELPERARAPKHLTSNSKGLSGFGFAVIYEILDIYGGEISLLEQPRKSGKSILLKFRLADG